MHISGVINIHSSFPGCFNALGREFSRVRFEMFPEHFWGRKAVGRFHVLMKGIRCF